jgi:hypothetical protein
MGALMEHDRRWVSIELTEEYWYGAGNYLDDRRRLHVW